MKRLIQEILSINKKLYDKDSFRISDYSLESPVNHTSLISISLSRITDAQSADGHELRDRETTYC